MFINAYLMYTCTYILDTLSGILLETDIDFQDSILPKKKGYLQEVCPYTHTHTHTLS